MLFSTISYLLSFSFFPQSDGGDPIAGGLGGSSAYCIGVITYYPPLDVSVCSSVSSELTMETAFGFVLDEILDEASKKRRRKRQSHEMIHGFFDREVYYEEEDETGTVGKFKRIGCFF